MAEAASNQAAADAPAVAGRAADEWRWTLASGLIAMLLAAAAILLPIAEWIPKGALVGWLLMIAGVAELALGRQRGPGKVRATLTASGLITAVAGLVFVVNPFAGFFPVANVVIAWLVVRGAWVLLSALRIPRRRVGRWFVLSGITDLLLGLLLILGLPVAIFIASLFGPTMEIVASFALVLAVSFLVTGLAQVAAALTERSAPSR